MHLICFIPLPEFTICSKRYSSSLSPQHVFSEESAEDGTDTELLRRFIKSLQSGSPSSVNISCNIGFFTCSSTLLKSSHPNPGFVLTFKNKHKMKLYLLLAAAYLAKIEQEKQSYGFQRNFWN